MKAINYLRSYLSVFALVVFISLSSNSRVSGQNKIFFSTETSISTLLNNAISNRAVPSFILTGGYQIQDVFSIGLATGTRVYSIPNYQNNSYYPFIPVQLDLKILLRKGKNVPLFFGRAGYSFSTRTSLPWVVPGEFAEIGGGPYFTAGFGYRYHFREDRALSFHLAYEAQDAFITYNDDLPYNHFFMVGMGFNFFI